MKKILLGSIILASVTGFAYLGDSDDYRIEYRNNNDYYKGEISERHYLYEKNGNSKAYVRITGGKAYLEIDGYTLTGLKRVSRNVYQTSDRTVRLELVKSGTVVKAYIDAFGKYRTYISDKYYNENYSRPEFESESDSYVERFTRKYYSYDGSELSVTVKGNTATVKLDGDELYTMKKKSGRVYESNYTRLILENNKAYLKINGREREFSTTRNSNSRNSEKNWNISNRFVGNYISNSGKKLLVIANDKGAFTRLDGEDIYDYTRTYGRVYVSKYGKLTLTNNKAYLNVNGKHLEFRLLSSKSEDFAK
ncbi:hypothetical protein [Caviibacter abscessus]|uniref:hypothetical protein n=1 Tax=Caviibacter abscessus TaxID=1766719 RepID=UPI00082EA211|nr:hypothetical protein [Caviibacter abscessus]